MAVVANREEALHPVAAVALEDPQEAQEAVRDPVMLVEPNQREAKINTSPGELLVYTIAFRVYYLLRYQELVESLLVTYSTN